MPTYQDLLAEVKSQIREISAADAAARLSSDEPPVLIDVREPDEYDQGAIDGSVHIPRGNLESRIGGARARPLDADRHLVPVGRALGLRRALARGARLRGRRVAGRRLRRLEAERLPLEHAERAQRGAARPLLASHADSRGRRGRAAQAARLEGAARRRRRSRLARGPLPRRGRRRHDRIVDADIVDESNLQRQVLHSMASIGMPKIESARQRIEDLNPDVQRDQLPGAAHLENIDRMLEGVDVIVDGTDNFPTRYLLNDASLRHASRSCTHRSSASRASSRSSSPTRAPATAASSRSRRRPSSRLRAPRAACSAPARASWARCRPEEALKLLLGSASRSPAG